MKNSTKIILALIFALQLLLSGCGMLKVNRRVTNYYVLDYKKSTEDSTLVAPQASEKTLEILDADINRTYSKSQLVVKENFATVRYLPFDLWANRLNDAVPDLIVQRLRAYNIFRQVDRSTGEFEPDYYLETNILNLEKIESDIPRAYMRIEFYLREANTQKIVLTYKNERSRILDEDSMIFLVQAYNEMIMKESDILAAKFRIFLGVDQTTELSKVARPNPLEAFIKYEALESLKETYEGELVLRLKSSSNPATKYTLEGADASNPISRNNGEFNLPMSLPPGLYNVIVGGNEEVNIQVSVSPKMRTIVTGLWSELVVKIIDERRNRVRLPYELLLKNPDRYDYDPYGSDYSIGDEDLGQPDKVWILNPGRYMVKLGGGSWADLKDFTTVDLNKGENETLTLVVDPTGERNLLLGAGVLGDELILTDRAITHKGALHANISFAGNNSVDSNDPTYSFTITGQLENNLEANFPMTRITSRSFYDLGLNNAKEINLHISTDSYSLKNVLLFTPWERNKALRNFSFYGRADLQTHFFDETTHFAQPKNVMMVSSEGETTLLATNQNRIQTKTSFFPMRLKQGAGITYRLVVNPRVSLSLRSGYGWLQEFNNDSYAFTRTDLSGVPEDILIYDIYTENKNLRSNGLESTLVLSAINIFDFIRINSTFDVLFPMNARPRYTRIESENRFNFRVYRNISLDVKLNVLYDKSNQDWVVFDYGSFLRLSLYF